MPARSFMADIKPQVYKDPRPAEEFDPFYERAATREPDWVYDVARVILTPPTTLFYRAWAIGTENVPISGPVILAPNHFSNWDHFFVAVYVRRKLRFMAKSQLFGGNPALTFILAHGGAFPVRRGHRDQQAFATADAILERGGCMLIYAEGGRSRTGGLGEPKPGVGYLALESGVPVVPVAIHGSLGVRRWRKLRFPKVTIQYGEPLTFDVVEGASREQAQEAADEIFGRVREMYSALDEKGRRGVSKSLREGVRARTEQKVPAGQAR
jgi:1-acyl-sn-glycerol-3-phosphate acyltransferase